MLFFIIELSGFASIFYQLYKDRLKSFFNYFFNKKVPQSEKNVRTIKKEGLVNISCSLEQNMITTEKCPAYYSEYPKDTILQRCIHCGTDLPSLILFIFSQLNYNLIFSFWI